MLQAHTALTVRSPGGLTQMALGNLHAYTYTLPSQLLPAKSSARRGLSSIAAWNACSSVGGLAASSSAYRNHPLLHGGGPLDKSHVWDLQRLAG